MEATDPPAGVPAEARYAVNSTRTMSHRRIVQRWRSGLADPFSAEIISYVRYDGRWWRRTSDMWEEIPDGPAASALSAEHARLAPHRDATDGWPAPRGRDPWTIARNRRRMGIACGKPAAFMPMRAIDPRPFPHAVCQRSPVD